MRETNVRMMPASSIEQRRQRKRKKRLKRKIIITSILIVGISIGILFTPLFNLSEIVLSGNKKITYEEIITKGEITKGKNLFSLNLKKIGTSISKMPYINTVEVKRKLPDKLLINVTESVPAAYIAYKNIFVVIDKNGKVLERVGSKGGYKIPQVLGIITDKAEPSQKISVKDKEKFKKTLEILRDLYNNNFIDRIQSISMSKEEIILSISDVLTVEMGSYEQFNAKIVMVKEIVSNLPADSYGVIDARNANRVYYDRAMPEKPEDKKSEDKNNEKPEDKPAASE